MTSAAPAGSVPVSGRNCSSMTGAGPANSRSSNPRSLVRVWWSRACRERSNSTRGAGAGDLPGRSTGVAELADEPPAGKAGSGTLAPTNSSRGPAWSNERHRRHQRFTHESRQRRGTGFFGRLGLQDRDGASIIADRTDAGQADWCPEATFTFEESRRGAVAARRETLERAGPAELRARRAAWLAGAGPARVARTVPGTPCGEPRSRTRPRPANA